MLAMMASKNMFSIYNITYTRRGISYSKPGNIFDLNCLNERVTRLDL